VAGPLVPVVVKELIVFRSQDLLALKSNVTELIVSVLVEGTYTVESSVPFAFKN